MDINWAVRWVPLARAAGATTRAATTTATNMDHTIMATRPTTPSPLGFMGPGTIGKYLIENNYY